MKDKDIKNRIREVRKERGLSQKELAQKMGVSQQTIANYENGKRKKIKVETWAELANIFNVSVGYLQGIDEAKNNIAVINLDKEFKEVDEFNKKPINEIIRLINEDNRKIEFINDPNSLKIFELAKNNHDEQAFEAVKAIIHYTVAMSQKIYNDSISLLNAIKGNKKATDHKDND